MNLLQVRDLHRIRRRQRQMCIRDSFSKLLEEWERFLESGLLVRKGNRFFLSEPNGMELSNQVLVSMFKWWDKIN